MYSVSSANFSTLVVRSTTDVTGVNGVSSLITGVSLRSGSVRGKSSFLSSDLFVHYLSGLIYSFVEEVNSQGSIG